jgi:hypothetical protein
MRTWSGKRQLGSSRACRSEFAAPRECLGIIISISSCLHRGSVHTARSDIIVVVQLVDSLDLPTNVELMGDVVQVLHSRVVRIATKNVLSLLRPREQQSASARPTCHTDPLHIIFQNESTAQTARHGFGRISKSAAGPHVAEIVRREPRPRKNELTCQGGRYRQWSEWPDCDHRGSRAGSDGSRPGSWSRR